MNDSRKFTRGEIYYIKTFPTVGHEQRSGRPAVIVSNNDINSNSGVVEICYLTLREKPDYPTHVMIDRGPCINSTILCEQVTTVSVDKIGDYMCRIPDTLEESLNLALCVSLGLSNNKELPSKSEYSATPTSVLEELKCLKAENAKLRDELYLTRDSNIAVKEKSVAIKAELDIANNRVNMYERMYNDLLDRLMNRGTK